ncbi:MAG: hypothetical protein L6R45_10425 [Anaerolineae bacterium]|nr:hypothetical protein [Anaerolineae bacterium]
MNIPELKKIEVTSHHLIWLIYLLLLGVLLPHTAWAFAKFEPEGYELVAWGGAFAFEAAIAVLTHRLAKHIETIAKIKSAWRKFTARYLNAYGGGLAIAWLVSTLANLAHSVEFGQTLKIFEAYDLPAPVYAIAFGAILPTTSLLFARILSGVIEEDQTEGEPNPELEKAKEAIRDLKGQLRQAEEQAKESLRKLQVQLHSTEERANTAEQRAAESEARFRAAGDIFVKLMEGPKRDRVLAAMERWPQLSASAVAIITETSPSYVSEVKNGTNGNGRAHGA